MASDDDDKAKSSHKDGDGEPEAKKAKVAAPEPQTNAAGETFFNLSNKRRVTIRSYNKMALIDIREVRSGCNIQCVRLTFCRFRSANTPFWSSSSSFLRLHFRKFYGDNDDKPGKKGISLSVDQFEKLKELVAGGEIDEALKKLNKE